MGFEVGLAEVPGNPREYFTSTGRELPDVHKMMPRAGERAFAYWRIGELVGSSQPGMTVRDMYDVFGGSMGFSFEDMKAVASQAEKEGFIQRTGKRKVVKRQTRKWKK